MGTEKLFNWTRFVGYRDSCTDLPSDGQGPLE